MCRVLTVHKARPVLQGLPGQQAQTAHQALTGWKDNQARLGLQGLLGPLVAPQASLVLRGPPAKRDQAEAPVVQQDQPGLRDKQDQTVCLVWTGHLVSSEPLGLPGQQGCLALQV